MVSFEYAETILVSAYIMDPSSVRRQAPLRVPLIYLGAIGSMFWLHLAHGIAVALLLPRVLVALSA
jgi:hypothetical protein